MPNADQPDKRLARRRRERDPFTSGAELPLDLVQKSVKRLGWVALTFAMAVVLLPWLGRTFKPAYTNPLPDFGQFDLNVRLSAALGGAICFLAG